MSATRARYWHFITLSVSAAALALQFHLVLIAPEATAGTRVVRYFSYFTIQSNFIVCLVAASLVLNPDRDGRLWLVVRLDSLVCIVVTGIVAVTVLRPNPPLTGLAKVCDVGLHEVTPVLAAIGWLLFGPRPRFDWGTFGYATIFPVAWLVYTLVRGANAHWYPYPFINVDSHGYGRVAVNSLIVAVLILSVAAVVVTLDRRLMGAPGRPDTVDVGGLAARDVSARG